MVKWISREGEIQLSEKQKLIFRVSLGLNIFLLVFVAWGYMKINFIRDQLFLTQVEYKLVKLEGLIANQTNNNWTEPDLVKTELGQILNEIGHGLNKTDQLGSLSDGEIAILYKLYKKLNQYPHDEKGGFSDLTEMDKRNFEELRGNLRDAGLRLNIQVSDDMKPFMIRAEKLEEKLEGPLN